MSLTVSHPRTWTSYNDCFKSLITINDRFLRAHHQWCYICHVSCNIFPRWCPLTFPFKKHILVNTLPVSFMLLWPVFVVALKIRLHDVQHALYGVRQESKSQECLKLWGEWRRGVCAAEQKRMARPQRSSSWSHLWDLLWKCQPVERKWENYCKQTSGHSFGFDFKI